jgi:AraC family transcriptional regulator, arabinose operon regulatory protein
MGSDAASYGVLSWLQKDNIYWFGDRGFLFTSPWVVTERTVRYHATLLLTASGEPFELEVGGRTRRLEAAILAPLTPRGLCTRDLGQISVHIGIRHPRFADFRRISRPGALALDRNAFRRFDRELLRSYEGRLAPAEARRLFEGLIAVAVARLPAPGPVDPRWELVQTLLSESPTLRLTEVAQKLEVSLPTASAIFNQAIGLPLRAYHYATRCDRAAKRLLSGATLTQLALDAGFTDSAHFTRSWQRSFGQPPSYTRDDRRVRVVV